MDPKAKALVAFLGTHLCLFISESLFSISEIVIISSHNEKNFYLTKGTQPCRNKCPISCNGVETGSLSWPAFLQKFVKRN